MKRLLTPLIWVFALSAFSVNATHMRGGEIFWRCITADNRAEINNEFNANFTVLDHGKFVFISKLYGDCTGAVAILNNFSVQFQIGGYSGGGPTSSPTILVQANDISPDCFSSTLRWSCGTPNAQGGFNSSSATGPLNGIGATAEYIFRSNAFQLNGSPPVNGAWTISIGPHCCRNSAVNVVGQPQFFLKSEMYPYPSVANPRTHGANPPFTPMFPCYDNSPEFLELPNVVSCNGYPFTYGPLAFDRELDSLVYDWATPLISVTGSVPYSGGYSFTNPMPSTAPNVAASLDPVTGLITFESYVNGNFTTNTEVLAYRCAIPIAAVYRDVQITTANCDAAYTSQNPPMLVPANDPPSVTFVPDSTLTFTTPATNIYRFTVEAGTLVEFVLNAQDFDLLPNSNFQTITFEAASGQLGGPNWNNPTDCDNPPCAIITPAVGQTSFVSTLNNTVEFSWQTECSHLAANVGCGVFSNEYVFYMKMEDNFCPTPARTLITVVIDVQAGTADPPELVCASPVGPNQTELTFLPAADTGFQYNFYIVEIDTNGSGNFFPIDTIYDFDPGSITVTDPSSAANFYRLRTNSGCNYVSPGSNVVGTFTLNLTQRPVASPDKDTADLSWTNPLPGSNDPIDYFVEYEFPAGSDNWVLAGTSSTRNWIEPMLLCSLEVSFRVGYEAVSSDSSVTCVSYSTMQSGVFQNTSNDDTTIVNYVTVNANGRAEISFEQSEFGDVVEYQIHWWNDSLGAWEIIDTAGALGNYTWPASQASSRVERFRVVSVDSCGNISDSIPVRPHNTLLLNSSVDICAGTNTLTWNRYKGWGNEVIGYQIRADIDDQQGGVSPNVLLFAGGREDTLFVQTEFVPEAIYCYRVIAIRDDSVTMSESFPICMNPGVPNPSDMLYISEVDVRGNGIFLRGFADGEADATHITIERSRTPNGTYFEVARIDMPTIAPYTFTFVDYLANPSENVYYYRLIAADSCGGIDTISNTVNNIHLSVEHKRNEQNWVSWNSFGNFAGELIGYEIYRAEREEGPFELLDDDLLPSDTVYVDNLQGLDPDVNTLCYYVRAVEVNNPFVDLPSRYIPGFARSNRACVTQKAKLVMPNAFRPNSSVEKNQTFGPDLRYVDVQSFEMVIIDRWGKIVFETKNPTVRWDGTFNGNLSPTGVYTYVVRYQTLGDLPQEQKGSFTLVN